MRDSIRRSQASVLQNHEVSVALEKTHFRNRKKLGQVGIIIIRSNFNQRSNQCTKYIISHLCSCHDFCTAKTWFFLFNLLYRAGLGLFVKPLWCGYGGFPSEKATTGGFEVFIDIRLHGPLNKHSNGQWFKTPWRSCDPAMKVCQYLSRKHTVSWRDQFYINHDTQFMK